MLLQNVLNPIQGQYLHLTEMNLSTCSAHFGSVPKTDKCSESFISVQSYIVRSFIEFSEIDSAENVYRIAAIDIQFLISNVSELFYSAFMSQPCACMPVISVHALLAPPQQMNI